MERPHRTRIGIVGRRNADGHIGRPGDIDLGVLDCKGTAIIQVDPHTGEQTVLSQGGLLVNFTLDSYDSFHSSPDFLTPRFAGDTVGIGRARLNAFNRGTGRPYLEDATFWRMRDVSLSYELPAGAVRKLWSGARYVRLSISGRNLVTITKYPGYDPEGEETSRSLAQGSSWELWGYPPSRAASFSVDLGF